MEYTRSGETYNMSEEDKARVGVRLGNILRQVSDGATFELIKMTYGATFELMKMTLSRYQ